MQVIFIDPDGTTTGVASAITQRMSLGNRQRVSHIEPAHPVLRWVFHVIRKRVSDESRLAEFTRRWKCHWRARIFNGPILGPFSSRASAISAEVTWINNELEGVNDA